MTLGTYISQLRRQKGMTQLELAGKLGVTDKAVSKWERDLSCPDVSTLPQLAQILGVTTDQLLQLKKGRPLPQLVHTVLVSIALAMGVATAVLSALGQLPADAAPGLLGIGLACLAAAALKDQSHP